MVMPARYNSRVTGQKGILVKAEITDRDLGSSRGVNIELPDRAKVKPYTWRDSAGHWVSGVRIESMSRRGVRILGEALIEAARQHAVKCGYDPEDTELLRTDENSGHAGE